MRAKTRGALALITILLAAVLATACATAREERREQGESRASAAAIVAEATQLHATDSGAMLSRGIRQRSTATAATATTRQVTLEGVPAAASSLRVALRSLHELPDGAEYTAREGRAGVSVRRSGDELEVTGSCDSIARRCEIYESRTERAEAMADSLGEELQAARREVRELEARAEAAEAEATASRTLAERRSSSGRAALKWLLTGVAAGIAITILLIIKTSKRNGST